MIRSRVKNISVSSLFALALICFSFPFINVRCAGVKTTSFSGIRLANGLKINKAFINLYANTRKDKPKREIKESDEIKLRASLWTSMVCILGGSISSFLGKFALSSVLGSIGAIMLLLFWYGVNSFIQSEGFINISFAPTFWITLIFALLGSILSVYFFRRIRDPS